MGDNLKTGGLWVLTDGKIGDDVQCLAIADALSPAFDKKVIDPRQPWAAMAPWGPVDPKDNPVEPESVIAGPPPDIVIASGRRTMPYARALKKRGSKIVMLKDPRIGRAIADVVWAPAHDFVKGENIISTLTSPHGLTAKIESSRKSGGAVLNGLPKPILGVVLGGPSGGARYAQSDADELAAAVEMARQDFASLVITSSRRTPGNFIERIKQQIDSGSSIVWAGEGKNPYVDILAHSDALIVAADSHNMISEALASGVGVYAWRPRGLSGKMIWFVDQLVLNGNARNFAGDAAPFDVEAIDATPEIAAAVRQRLAI